MSDQQRSSRRDFLKGKPAGQSDEAVPEGPLSGAPPRSDRQWNRQASYLEQFSKNAMACEFEIFFNLQQYPQSGTAAGDAFQLIDQLEDQMTVYRDHSELSQINRDAFQRDVEVESRLYGLLRLASSLSQQTGGAFDMTAGPLSELWQFDRRQGRVPDQSEIADVLQRVGNQHVRLDDDRSTIRFLRPGLKLNLGGIGKGHALDRVASDFLRQDINDFIIHGGQSSVLAFGTCTRTGSPGEPQSPGWSVGITHPRRPSVRLAEVTLIDEALGTSGTERQGFFHRGERFGHIIDPRTGWPTSHVLSSTVVCQTAAVADALATAFFVMDVDEVESFCKSHPEIGALLVLAGRRSGPPSIVTFNMDESRIRWCET